MNEKIANNSSSTLPDSIPIEMSVNMAEQTAALMSTPKLRRRGSDMVDNAIEQEAIQGQSPSWRAGRDGTPTDFSGNYGTSGSYGTSEGSRLNSASFQ